MQVAIVKRALVEPHCGDQAGWWCEGARRVLCVADGLGHGEAAERAAAAALEFVAAHLQEPLPQLFAGCDRALRGTRGVALGIAVASAGALTYAGIGNTRALVAGPETVRLMSQHGIVGAGYRSLAPQSVPLYPSTMVILSTDGIAEPIDLSRYDQALRADVDGLAAAIVGDWRRKQDDAAVLVYRHAR